RAAQVRAAGRPYDERRDEYDKGVHFQDVQFDHDIARLTSYNGNRRPALHELDGDSGCRNYEDKNA
ncbi:MAG: hypothetical protein ACREQ5_26505, partial [Candidatus Dormibacteria bacterium]